MARKTKRAQRSAWNAEQSAQRFRLGVQRMAQAHLSELGPELEHIYRTTRGNPLAAWKAYQLCRAAKLPSTDWPGWLLTYLDNTAKRLLALMPDEKSIKVRDKKTRKVVRTRDVRTTPPHAVATACGFARPSRTNIPDQFGVALYLKADMYNDLHRVKRTGERGAFTRRLDHYAKEYCPTKDPKEVRRMIRDGYHRWLRDKPHRT